jgi:DNA-binding MarR family transcriptional regulator
MSTDQLPRDLRETVLRSSRRAGSHMALFSAAVAERLGLAGTDVECLDVLLMEGALCVGRLAELTGLTTGSATRMVDRLEQAGLVRRVADPVDRRRVLVEPGPDLAGKMNALHDSLRRAQSALLDTYTDEELRLIAGFLDASTEIMRREVGHMRSPTEQRENGAGGSYAAQVGGVTAGRLVFLSGAPLINVTGDSDLTELYRAHFSGPVPKMRVRDGVVTVSYPRFGWFDWRAQVAGQTIDASAHWNKDEGEITLNARLPWAIELRGGVSKWASDLRQLTLESFELRGGASKIQFELGVPAGPVSIQIGGGVSQMHIVRPNGVPVALHIAGGYSSVTIDGTTHKSGSGLQVSTPGLEGSRGHYAISIGGGASKLVIDSR